MNINFSYDKNYLVVFFNNSDEIINYQLETILNHCIANLAPCKKQIKNNTAYLYYDITSAISLKEAALHQKMTSEQFFGFLNTYLENCLEIEKYVLPTSGIIFDLEHIYINPVNFKPAFIYLPIHKNSLEISEIKSSIKLLVMSNILDISQNHNIQNLIEILSEDINSILELNNKIKNLKENHTLQNADIKENLYIKEPINLYENLEPAPSESNQETSKIAFSTILLNSFAAIVPVMLVLFKILPAAALLAVPILLIIINLLLSHKFLIDKISMNLNTKTEKTKNSELATNETFISKPYENSNPENNATELIKVFPYIRNSKGDIRYIDKNYLRIGKLSEKVDYCINNSSVSKIHADILIRDKKMFVIDLNSKNGTFINDMSQRLESNIEYELKNGDKLILANEEFTVHFYEL